MWIFFFLLACPPDLVGNAYTDDGSSSQDSGLGDAIAGDPFASLPSCTAVDGTGILDVVSGCFGDVCAEDSFADWVDELGTPECETVSGTVKCAWSGLYVYVADGDGDAVADDPNEVVGGFWIESPFADSTLSGLGIGVEMRCFVDAFGPPPVIEMTLQGDSYQIEEIIFVDPSLGVYDESDAVDGIADKLYVSGP